MFNQWSELKKDPTGEYPIIVIELYLIDEYLKKIEESGDKTVMPKMSIGDFDSMQEYVILKDMSLGFGKTSKNNFNKIFVYHLR